MMNLAPLPFPQDLQLVHAEKPKILLTPFAPTTRITRQCQSDGSKGLPVHHKPHGLGRSLSWTLARKNFLGTSPGRDVRVDGRVAFADDFGILDASS